MGPNLDIEPPLYLFHQYSSQVELVTDWSPIVNGSNSTSNEIITGSHSESVEISTVAAHTCRRSGWTRNWS